VALTGADQEENHPIVKGCEHFHPMQLATRTL
jgi:hypothetical protein